MRARVWLCAGSLVLLVPASAWNQDATAHPAATPGLRQEIESLEAHLDRAVARVSVPHAGILMGRSDATRGYRLPGYGILFVLAPRALPGDHALYVLRRGHGSTGELHVQDSRSPRGEDTTWEPERVEEIERQVLVLQRVAEAERRAAEEDMERIVHDVRVRLAVPTPSPRPGPDATPEGSTDRVPAPFPSDDLQLPATPPWKFWFESGPTAEVRSPDRVVAEVKAAVIGALEAEAGRVPGLRRDEFVTVAVDFVPGGLFGSHPRPERTLVVRARQGDLEASARGAMTATDFEKKVEVFEY